MFNHWFVIKISSIDGIFFIQYDLYFQSHLLLSPLVYVARNSRSYKILQVNHTANIHSSGDIIIQKVAVKPIL